jgi:hypothetical protein
MDLVLGSAGSLLKRVEAACEVVGIEFSKRSVAKATGL